MKKLTLFCLACMVAFLSSAADSAPKRGRLCLTFDDCHWNGWVAAMPIFEKYNAKASFFPHSALSAGALKCMKKLHDAGHTVGPHTVHHRMATDYVKKNGFEAFWNDEVAPQMKAYASVGIVPEALAFPNNASNPEINAQLVSRGIKRLRGGLPKARPHDPKGLKRSGLVPFEKLDAMYMSEAAVATNHLMRGVGIGTYYNTDIDDLVKGIRRAAANNETMVLYSHDISKKPSGIGMKTEWLEAILKAASEEGMAIVGFDDLPDFAAKK